MACYTADLFGSVSTSLYQRDDKRTYSMTQRGCVAPDCQFHLPSTSNSWPSNSLLIFPSRKIRKELPASNTPSGPIGGHVASLGSMFCEAMMHLPPANHASMHFHFWLAALAIRGLWIYWLNAQARAWHFEHRKTWIFSITFPKPPSLILHSRYQKDHFDMLIDSHEALADPAASISISVKESHFHRTFLWNKNPSNPMAPSCKSSTVNSHLFLFGWVQSWEQKQI